MPLDAHYTHPRLAALYDAGNGWGEDRDYYLSLAGPSEMRVLDLGCGTGLLCDAYAARGHVVTGVDPSPGMIEVARRKPHASAVEWVCASAQDFESPGRFDLVVMTGHAFQVLLEDTDVTATLETMRDHLAPGGRAVFESRNPTIDWASRWNGTETLDLPDGEVVVERTVLPRSSDRITFDTAYHLAAETIVSRSTLRFWTADALGTAIAAVGLAVHAVNGDWHGAPFVTETSEEMIFVLGLAP